MLDGSLDREAKRNREEIESFAPGMIRKDGRSFATIDGVNTVPVDDDLAEDISLALKLQDKIDEALMAGHRPGFLKMLKMLNCRKAISAVTRTVPLRKLLRRPKINRHVPDPLEQIEVVEEASGIPGLMKDVQESISSGSLPVLGSMSDMQIGAHMDEIPNDVPCVVHIFDIKAQYAGDILQRLVNPGLSISIKDVERKLNRNHTFLILGKDEAGKYICFQKQGPEIYHRFELRELDSLLKSALGSTPEKMHLSFFHPLKKNAVPKNKKKIQHEVA